MLEGLSNTVFLESESISMVPVVSAEWNHNLFNPPYITTAGSGATIDTALTDGTVASVTTGGKENFTTKSFALSNGVGSVEYTASGLNGEAYKVITYIKTTSANPTIINIAAKGTDNQHGSSQEEVSSLGWTKIVTYIGSVANNIQDLTYKINANSLAGLEDEEVTVMFTVPKVYETTYFDYQNNSLWPTDAPFSNFRPGESYVSTGNVLQSFPSSYRKITKYDTDAEGPFYSPVTSIIQNPTSIVGSPDLPALKNAAASSDSSFKYFVSDSSFPELAAVYSKDIPVNKLVIKLNTSITTPSISIAINGSTVSVDGSTTIAMPKNSDNVCTGVLVLYWTGSAWTKTKWSVMPEFTDAGSLTKFTSLNRISISQVSQQINPYFASYISSSNFTDDTSRMQVVEISPRLEIDLSNFTEEMAVEKSLDEKSTNLPISGINSNTGSITLSGIPIVNNNSIVPIFSSQNNETPTVLSGMLRKGIKLYLGYKVSDYSIQSSGTVSGLSAYIPAGVFYSDNWNESDIKTINIQGYDIVRYLQSLPASDYVVNGKTSFDTISDILDLSGFTDYDHDSLYQVCNDQAAPFDLYYYSVYSKDTTLVGSMNELLTPYQIAAYVDEYGIIKFKSLNSILTNKSSQMTLMDANILEGGYSISNKPRPGKISIKYTQPKTKQSPSVKSVQSTSIADSPSLVYITSNDILWEQQKTDAVGFNYVNDGIDKDSTKLSLNVNDQNDIFHSYNRDASGYSIIENEIMSFDYKEYKLSKNTPNILGTYSSLSALRSDHPVGNQGDAYSVSGQTYIWSTSVNDWVLFSDSEKFVSIKNDLELQSEISKFIKKNRIGIRTSTATITNAVGDGVLITYTANNNFKVNDYVSVSGILPQQYNLTGYVYESTSTTFKIKNSVVGTYQSGGEAFCNGGYDITVGPTGNITNIKRGLFGTSPDSHKRITSLSSKGLRAFKWDYNTYANAQSCTEIINDHDDEDSVLPSVDKIKIFNSNGTDICISPNNHLDPGYQTYSVKFELPESSATAAGLFFNCEEDYSDMINVWLIRFNRTNPKTSTLYSPPKYEYVLKLDNADGTFAWTYVTGECNKIIENAIVIAGKAIVNGQAVKYRRPVFNLQAVTYVSDGSDGEEGTPEDPVNIIKVYLNGIQITGWMIPGVAYNQNTNPDGSGWKPLEDNLKTGLVKNPSLGLFSTYGKLFGFRTTDTPSNVDGLNPELDIPASNNTHTASLREIHATTKPLLSRNVNYIYQDIEFLDGIINDKPIALEYPTYIMQTTPEVHAINIYDVEYGTPAAITALHSNIQYMWRYAPGKNMTSQQEYAKTLVPENSVSYSTLRNTGHKGKIAIANNSSHIVFVKKDADSVNNFAVNFTMWTPEAIVHSDPELIEKIIDIGNASEVVQLDTKWIQTKDAAYKTMKIIEFGMTGFAKDITLNIFGNPLIQVGDIITLTYNLKGISQQKCLVSAVSHSFSSGLATTLTLNRIEE
jgi:hypothetical protein